MHLRRWNLHRSRHLKIWQCGQKSASSWNPEKNEWVVVSLLLEVTEHVDLRVPLIIWKMAVCSGISGGGSGSKVISHYQKWNMHKSFRGEGSTYTNWRQFGAHKSNASSECPNIWVPIFGVQTGQNRVPSVPQIDLSVCADRKIVILYVYLCNFTKKSQFYRAVTQKKLRWFSFMCKEASRTVLCVSAYLCIF